MKPAGHFRPASTRTDFGDANGDRTGAPGHMTVNIPPTGIILLSEMRPFRWDVTPGCHARPDQPAGGHDDWTPALPVIEPLRP